MRAMVAAGLMVSGCVPAASGVEPTARANVVGAITYETSPCFGACPVYRVTVRADGSGTFAGRAHTAVIGERSFTVTPAQYRAFADHLTPLRPARGSVRLSGEQCRLTATDLPSAEVTWDGGDAVQRYYLYYGCDMSFNRPARDRLERAPALLPIAGLIGR